jgi:molybdopterin-guanine dinucleotide biosynthesis protein A
MLIIYYNNILEVVLIGGQSKRFSQDKSQVQMENKILIDYILLQIFIKISKTLFD